MDEESAAVHTTYLTDLIAQSKHNKGAAGQLQRVLNFLGHNPVQKTDNPVRIGVLGASQVATYALIWPAQRIADVEVAAVAARDPKRAADYAKKHGIPVAHGSYQQLVDDPSLTAIYVATPNGLHGEWAEAALRAGKHVLCEKPFTANAEEARLVQSVAAKQRLLCREAFHYKEHPANKAVAQLLQSGAIGQLQQLAVQVLIPAWAFSKDDIRFQARLAGGTMMDAGCYCAHTLRFFPGCSRPHVTSATAGKLMDGGAVDGRMQATLAYPKGSSSSSSSSSALGAAAVGKLEADLRHKGLWPRTRFVATGTLGRVEINNFILPSMGHNISITRTLAQPGGPGNKSDCSPDSLGDGLKEQRHSIEVYGSGESNYYYQLTRFISDLRVLEDKQAPKEAKRAVQRAMDDDARDAIDNMTLIDSIYTAAGLPLRQPTHVAAAAAAAAASKAVK
uniref:D-xylose 1-dehydrogenase (NADP(+), D-xylono-1,5-lactone-forming) n=2 Tax=Tetradesmus obliquus TaxID=3088 RepID=A0A383VUP1_TETOB|eukprot:jgi/Sobl393_1/7623/SZX68126.1